jgi:UDP-hydrolysing UDP-N-acetyl-D-glucosamine 2-epimerase
MKICIPITSRAGYGRLRPLIQHIHDTQNVTLQLVTCCSANIDRYGAVKEEVEKDFPVVYTLSGQSYGDRPITMAQTAGLLMAEISVAFEQLEPDVVIAHADRHEMLGVAAAAAYMNIPLAHTQGGEVTGSIDERVRWAITALADFHFPATRHAAKCLRAQTSEEAVVVPTGCTSIDRLVQPLPELADIDINKIGYGWEIDFDEPYMLACLHSDTTISEMENKAAMGSMFSALKKYQTIWLLPNIDAYGQAMAKVLNQHVGSRHAIRCVKHVPQDQFYSLMKHCTVMVGNSSAGIREGSFLGVPVVNVGSRQTNREVSDNVTCIESLPPMAREISADIEGQIEHGEYPSSTLYGDGAASPRILSALLAHL